MQKPQMILFDYGQTLIAQERFNGIKGTTEVLKHAVENKYNLTPAQVQAEADAVNRELMRIDPATRAKYMVEIPNHMFTSYLYESPEHGDMIIGNAMIVKQDGEDLRLLTQDEAIDLAKDMSKIRNVSIHEMTEFLSNLKLAEKQPEKSISAILRMGAEKGNRQPCRSDA